MKKRGMRWMALACMALCAALALTGCSSGDKGEGEPQTGGVKLNAVVAAKFALEDKVAEFGKTVNDALKPSGYEIVWTAVPMGDSDADPMATMAGIAKFAGMVSAKEVDVLIMDRENAERQGDNGAMFMPLSELFTQAEIDAFTHAPVTLSIKDDEGNATGEQSVPCGIDVSGIAGVKDATAAEDIAVYVVANTEHKEQAKALMGFLGAYQP